MPIIEYGDAKIYISEMSRGVALKCSSEALTAISVISATTNDSDQRYNLIGREIETQIAVHSPVFVRQNDNTISTGQVDIQLEDGMKCSFTLPLSKDGFDGLPFSLSSLWVQAASIANGYLLNELKKVPSRVTKRISESQSGSASSNESKLIPPPMKTTGE